MADQFPDELTRTTTVQRTDLVLLETKPDITGQEETKGMAALDLAKGWIEVPDTWTYNAVDQVVVPSDATLLYQKGWGVRFKQGGAYKYMYMTTVAAALLTLKGGSDYTVANAAITDIAVAPDPNHAFGFPGVFSYTSTLSGSGGSAGTYAETQTVSIFTAVGRMANVIVKKTITNKGSWSGDVRVAIPIAASSLANTIINPASVVVPNASITPRGFGYTITPQSYMMFVKTYGTADLQWADIATNDGVIINLFYPF